MTDPVVLIGLAGMALALVLLEATIRRTLVGAGLLFGYIFIEYIDTPLPPVQAGGFSVYAGDLVAVILLVAGIARLLRADRFTLAHYAVVAVFVIAVYALARGVTIFGPQESVNEFRRWLTGLCALIYFSLATPRRGLLDQVGRLWIWTGAALSLVAVGRWATLIAGLDLGPVLSPVDGGDIRVLGAAETLVIAQAAFIAAPAWAGNDPARRWDRIWAVLLVATALLLQHRTVWISMLVGVAVLFWRQPPLRRRFGGVLVAAAVLGVTFISLAFAGQSESLEQRAVNTDTFGWRLAGWGELLFEEAPDDAIEWAIGRPFGTGWYREVNGIVRDESPHSLYVEGLLRVGVVGVAVIVAVAVLALRAMLRRPPEGPDRVLSVDVLASLLAFLLVYSITYHPEPTNFVVIGIAVSLGLTGGSPTRSTSELAAPQEETWAVASPRS